MRRLRVVLVAALGCAAAAACTGLWVDKGNEYPCDFTQPEGVRDQACTLGWVCSVTNTCRRFTNEGPQFEGAPVLPVFDGGAALAPVLLYGQVRALSARPYHLGTLMAVLEQDGVEVFSLDGPVNVRKVTAPSGASLLTHREGGVFFLKDGQAQYAEAGSACTVEGGVGLAPGPLRNVAAARVGGTQGSGTQVALLRDEVLLPAGEVVAPRAGPGNPCVRFRPFDVQSFDGGFARDAGSSLDTAHLDVRWVERPVFETRASVGEPVVPVVLTRRGLFYRTLLGPTDAPAGDRWVELTADEDLDLLPPAQVRHDVSGSAWVVASFIPDALDGGAGALDAELRALTVLRLTKSFSEGPRLTRAQDDCRPCVGGRILTFTPVYSAAGLSVEVLCEGAAPQRALSVVRVLDSFATDRTKLCQTETLEPPFDLKEIAFTSGGARGRTYAVDNTLGGALAIGGRHGQLWVGTTLSKLLPLFHERVPRTVGTITLPADAGLFLTPRLLTGGALPVGFADRFLALPASANGLVALPLEQAAEGALPAGALPSAPIGEAPGWLVLSTGDLAQVGPRTEQAEGWLRLSFGPRLVDPMGEPAGPPHFAEAVAEEDGGVVAVVATANDSLYFVPGPLSGSPHPNVQAAVTPQLTPEPSFPVRSMTLERSPLGTDGKRFVRGYLVTSRNLYEFTLAGQPARWSARQIVLAAGEPLKVWMDHPKGGLGRVGFRDGTVFTLPGGFPLVQALPKDRSPDAGADRVLDYANLGGWPVALARSGLYVAGWNVLPDGSVDRKFPDGGPGKTMTWRLVTLPDGSEPWLGPDGQVPQGTLEVVRAPPSRSGGQQQTTFVLRLWGPLGRVWSVGSLTRVSSAQ